MTSIILFAGIILATIWLFLCIMMEGKKRTCVIIAGLLLDIILLVIYKKYMLLAIAVLGGLAGGLIPGLADKRKYKTAVLEMKGTGKLVLVFIIFFIMIFMTIAIAYPDLRVELW